MLYLLRKDAWKLRRKKKDISIFWHSNLRALQQAILEMYREKNEDKKFPEI